ncbi:MAG TPA: CBS domain-containing protein [Candidatus Acidoferrales bacterium]|nr:CBS domain-containing protein [Candidatus Acidoferrales bacterium]
MAFHDGYLSELVGRSVVVGPERRSIGRVVDFLVEKPDDTFPRIDGFVVKTSYGRRYVPTADVADLDHDGTVELQTLPDLPAKPDDQALYLISDLFDKQIVDVDGRKVVRINDLEIVNTGGTLRVVAADIGVSGLLYRLGAHRLAPKLVDRIPRTLIAWDNVAPISDFNPSQVRLAVSQSRLSRLHPSELADIIAELSASDASRVFASLDDETAADALEHLDSDVQKTIIEELGTERAAGIIEEMDSDDAADLLGELDEAKQTELLAEMEPETAGELRALVQYDDDTAGGLMNTDFVWIYPHRTVAATIDKIRELAPESELIYYLYVTDERRKLLGVLSLRTLLLALPTAFIHKLMETDIVSVTAEVSAEDVASTIARYDLIAVPVLDAEGVMLGIVTVDDAIDAIIPEKVANSLPRFVRHRPRRDQPVAAE